MSGGSAFFLIWRKTNRRASAGRETEPPIDEGIERKRQKFGH